MEILYGDTNFSHAKGEFCKRLRRNAYFFSCFCTPFVYETDHEFRKGNAGDILISPPGTVVYHGPQSKEEAFVNYWIYLTGDDFKELLEQYPLPLNIAFSTKNSYLVSKTFKKVFDELLLKQTGYEDIISSCIKELVIQLHRSWQKQQSSHSPMHRIEMVRETFLRHLDEEWTLKRMADLCDYSVSRFCALYSQHFGCSPKADLLSQRIALAKTLLRYSDLSITEISEQCGFQSIYYFSKYFKEREGCSPREYL